MRRATAFAPATVSNVAVGFDVLGFAIEGAGDEVTVTAVEGETVRISDIVDTTGTLAPDAIPLDPAKNTATVGLFKLIEDARPGFGFDVSVRKGIALGSGMGGSAASAVAALVAANSLLAEPLTKEALLAYALAAEVVACGASHPDNAAPSLFGGLTLIIPADSPRCVRLPVPRGLLAVLVHPHVRVDTRDSRAVLRPTVPLADHVRQSARLAGLVAACFKDDFELMRTCLEDAVIEPQRAALIPGFARVKAGALEAGALGASISGSGPSVFALVDDEETAARVRDSMVGAFKSSGVVEVDSWVSAVSDEGARVIR